MTTLAAYVCLQSPGGDLRTIPVADRRSTRALMSRGWQTVRIFRADLPWPAGQRLTCCAQGHAPVTAATREDPR
jgi:hypothetical protein